MNSKKQKIFGLIAVISIVIFSISALIIYKYISDKNIPSNSLNEQLQGDQIVEDSNEFDVAQLEGNRENLEDSDNNYEYSKIFIAKHVAEDKNDPDSAKYIETMIYDIQNEEIIEEDSIREDGSVSSVKFDADLGGITYVLDCGVLAFDYPTDEKCENKEFKMESGSEEATFIRSSKIGAGDRVIHKDDTGVYLIRSTWLDEEKTNNTSLIKQSYDTYAEVVLETNTVPNFSQVVVEDDYIFLLGTISQKEEFPKKAVIEKYNLKTNEKTLFFESEYSQKSNFYNNLTIDKVKKELLLDVYDSENNQLYVYKINYVDTVAESTKVKIINGVGISSANFSENARYYAFVEGDTQEKLHIFDFETNKLLNIRNVQESEINITGNGVWVKNDELFFYEIPNNSSNIKYIDLINEKSSEIEIGDKSNVYTWASKNDFLVYETKLEWSDCCGMMDINIRDIEKNEDLKLPEFFQNIEENFYDPTVVGISWF